MGLFTMHLWVSTETTDIHQEQQNQARCDPVQVESIIRKGAAGPATGHSALSQLTTPKHQQGKGM